MNLLIRINEWWLAALTVCSPIIGVGLFITGYYLELTGLIYAAIPLIILIPAIITALWVYTTGKILYRSGKHTADVGHTFRIFSGSMLAVTFYAVLLSAVLLFSVEKFFSFHYFTEMFRLEMKDLFHLSVLLLPLHFISVCGSWYGMHFIAKHMDQDGEVRNFSAGYFRNLISLLVLPAGLARVHSRIRSEDRRHEI